MEHNTGTKHSTTRHTSTHSASGHAKKSGSAKRRRRNQNTLPLMLLLFTTALVAVTLLIVFSDNGQDSAATPASPTATLAVNDNQDTVQTAAQNPADSAQIQASQAPAYEVRTGVLTETGDIAPADGSGTSSSVQPTEAPAVQSTVAPTAEPTAAPTAAPTPEPFSYLPVVSQGSNLDKRIAITIDDCFQTENLRALIKLTYEKGGKLTIFPIGENINNPNMPETLRAAVKLGFEIENHTWSHARVFRLPELEMASEIWRQSQALNQALGVNYQQHFFRLMGGDGMNDQRLHNYLDQLGFKGIAWWSLSGSDAEPDEIRASLAPGMIYLFHTTDRDTGILKQFIPYAISQGYELVTMNELLGYEDNAITELTPFEMPQPRPYAVDYATHKKGDYAWIIVQMQDRLRAMGYLKIEGESTGYYGDQTVAAVQAFQRDHGLTATGEADAATQKLILGVSGG